METINGNNSALYLNPRQIYIIKRANNKKIVESLQSFLKDFDEEEMMQFYIIDLVEAEQPMLKSQLYKDFMDEDGDRGAWDIIVRDFPEYKGSQSFSAWHFNHNIRGNKRQLIDIKEELEDIIWNKVMRKFDGSLQFTTANASANNHFKEFMSNILKSKNIDSSEWEEQIEDFTMKYLDTARKNRPEVIREFIGNRFDILDDYMGFCSWDISNTMMENFMNPSDSESPYQAIVEKNPDLQVSPRSVHARYRLRLITGDGKEYYPYFTGAINFALYILMLTNVGLKFGRDSFNHENWTRPKNKNFCETEGYKLCEKILALVATIKEMDINGISESKEFKKTSQLYTENGWKNDSPIDRFLTKELGQTTIQAFYFQENGGRCVPEGVRIDIAPEFKDTYKKKLKQIEELHLFNPAE